MKLWIARLALLGFSLALVLGFAEAALRATVYQNTAGYEISPGPNSEYTISRYEFTNKIRTNSLNMRWDEIEPRREGQQRVVCIGDSFTFGLGVELDGVHTAPRGRPACAARTAAVGRRHRRLRRGPAALLPAARGAVRSGLLVLQIYLGNDFYDAERGAPAHPDLAPKDAQAEAEREPLFQRVKGFLRQSRVLDLLWTNLTKIEWFDAFALRHGLRHEKRGILLREYPPYVEQLVANELAGLSHVIAHMRARGTDVVAFLIPDTLQLFERDHFDPALFDVAKPNALLREYFASQTFR
jgi:hypothetical protein